MNRTRILSLTILALLATSGFAAAASFTSYTQAVGVEAGGHVQAGAATAVGADIATHQTGQTPVVYASGPSQVSRSGAAALYRSANTYGNQNLTLLGESPGLAASYYSAVKNPNGNYEYSVRSIEGRSMATLAESAVTKHYTRATSVVVANPTYVTDYAGGVANATKSSMPLLYASSPSQYKALNATLARLGVQHVYTTKHVPTKVQSNLTADYTAVTNLSTGSGAGFINNQASSSGTSTLYVTGNIQSVPNVEAAAGSNDTLVVPASGSLTTINNYLQAHHPRVYVVANHGTVSKSDVQALAANTTRSVSRIGYASQQGLSTRLALRQLNDSDPLVAVGSTRSVRSMNGSVNASIPIRNYGFSGAKNVVVRLNKTANATYHFQTAPTSQNATTATWKYSALPANGTRTLTYSITGANGSVAAVPSVVSYGNAAGTSFHGAAFFGLGSWANGIRSSALGILSSLTSIHPTTPGGLVELIGVVVIVGVIAAAIWYLIRQQAGGPQS